MLIESSSTAAFNAIASSRHGRGRADLRAWRDAPLAMLARVTGVLTDIDDTLTRDGAIDPPALEALHALQAAGVMVVAVTGRPVGWSLPCVLEWPLAAIVAENGAVTLRRNDQVPHGVECLFAQDEVTRARNTERLRDVARRILAEVPQARLATDSAGRLTDIAIDHSEHAKLDAPAIERVTALMRASGMTATVSSIHINGWFGNHDKWSGAQGAVRLLTGRALADEVDRWVFVGDSTNDQAMFRAVPLAVGVANLMRFADALTAWPAYLTDKDRGHGVLEVANAIVAARHARDT